MEQEQEDDRRPTDSDQPTKKQRLNRPPLPPLINPNGIQNGLPANQVNQRMVDFEQGNLMNGEEQAIEQQQAGRKRKRRTRKASKKSRKASKKSRKARRYRR
jgi:hypothetical protein